MISAIILYFPCVIKPVVLLWKNILDNDFALLKSTSFLIVNTLLVYDRIDCNNDNKLSREKYPG